MALLHSYICVITIFAGFMVSFSKQPMNSIVFLLITFFNAFILLCYFNIEFLGLLFILVYVGAIAILFLFVIMMLNLKLRSNNILSFTVVGKILLILTFIYLFFFFIILFLDDLFAQTEYYYYYYDINSFYHLESFSNLEIIGQTLFNYFSPCFLIAGLVLLVALIGSIVLTFNFNLKGNQLLTKQLSRNRNLYFFS